MRDGQQGLLCSCASWPWGIGGGEQTTTMPAELKTWWWLPDRMEGGGDGALRFFLQFDPGKVDRTDALLGVSLSALFTRFLGWAKNARRSGASMAIADDAAVSAAALAAAVSVCLAAMHAASRRHHRRRRPRLSAAALAGEPSSAAARPRVLPAPSDGLRILSSSSKDASSENVIHGVSIGAGDDEPVIVARVAETAQAGDGEGTEERHGPPEEEEERKESDRLRELWLSLVEREQRLELRLQELDGLREREAAARELESRVSAAATEARLLRLKVSSLQEENGRLRARLEEMDDARAELARAKDTLRAIKARVQGEQDEAAALRARVAGGEERAAALAAEAAALREANAALEEENMELALRLREAEQAASSVHLAVQEDMAEEAKQLRETNESLTRQIEELRSDQYAHVEDLVYLKWVNACLRHELSDHGLQPPRSLQQEGHDADDGSLSSAMELSKSMSYRSSERAKQLMLRYGQLGLDPALLSPLHESMDGDDERTYARNYEPARSPAGASSVTTTTPAAASTAAAATGKKKSVPHKLKLLGNIKKLLPGGKRSQSYYGGGRDSSRQQAPAPAPSDEYLEKAMQWLSTHDVLDLDRSYESTPLSSCDRTPPSSVTTATTRGERGASSTRQEEDAATLSRSRSDAGASYGREASRYHSLRPDHPADETGVTAPEKQRKPRRRSEEQMSLTSPGAARA